jgi:transcriptional regulator GlxA family with amidase domain
VLKVTFILCNNMLATSVSLPLEQLYAAESLARASLPFGDQKKSQLLHVNLAAITRDAIATHTGLSFTPNCTISDLDKSDIIYLPALWRNPNATLRHNRALVPWLKKQYERGSVIAGVGTGCCFMAEAGLLDNKAATTHWHYFDYFQERYPLVNLKRQYFITQADNLYCTASVNSLADLTVHFIQRYFSHTIASHVERHFFHEIRRAYESSVSYQDSNSSHADEDIVQTQIWLSDNYGKSINLKNVAEQFEMSIRSFNRRFKNATGKQPIKYLQEVRINAAKDLLKTSNLSIDEIIYKVGYNDSVYFNKLFKKHHGTTAGQYRKTVRAKLFSLL